MNAPSDSQLMFFNLNPACQPDVSLTAAMAEIERKLFLHPGDLATIEHFAAKHHQSVPSGRPVFVLSAMSGVTNHSGTPVIAGAIAVGKRRQRSMGDHYQLEVWILVHDPVPHLRSFLYSAAINAARALAYHVLHVAEEADAAVMEALGFSRHGLGWKIGLVHKSRIADEPEPKAQEPPLLKDGGDSIEV